LANVETARGLRRALAASGHQVSYREVPEGHSLRTCWHHLDGVLTDLFPPRPGASATSVTSETPVDAMFRQQAEAIDRRFETARARCDDRWHTDELCVATLRLLHDEEVRLFAQVRAHWFVEITESNYWHRGRLKFPSRIAQLMERLDPR
jgi:hypothetical protein